MGAPDADSGGADTVGALLARQAEQHGDAPYVTCAGERLSFAAADRRADAVAAGLAEVAGLEPGERVAVISDTRVEVIDLFLGAGRAGVVQVPINVYLKGQFLRHQLTDADPAALVVDAAGWEAAAGLVDDVDALRTVVCLDEPPADAAVPLHPWDELADADPTGTPAPGLDAGSLHSIMYTSGTTGLPKGCMLSHGYHTHAGRASQGMVGYREDDVALTALPLYHQWARGTLVGALTAGMHLVLDAQFSAGGWLDRVRETGATIFMGVGPMGRAILATDERPGDDDHDLRVAFMIPFGPDAEAAWVERFGCRVFSQMYGQTETGAITFTPVGEDAPPGTVGRPSPHFEVSLRDDADRPVGTGEVGEIAVRPVEPHSLFDGYWRRPAETVSSWRNLWHHTGDLARRDEDGLLWFVDRKSDAIRRRGENVSSMELEQAIGRHPAVAEVAVHAVPAELGEDDIKACVVAADGADPAPERLFEHFREELPYFAIPRYVELVESLPRNATMRVRKHRLRDRGVTADTWDLEELGLAVPRGERR